ncbi:MAG TPA: imidazolonepropionase [Elusimicrobiota bacterium]|nr:imidazolonepropionase [Elusimicrobiota bacterium]
MKHLLVNAQVLTLAGPDAPRAGKEMSALGVTRDGAVLISNGLVAAAGFKEIVLRHPDASKARLMDMGGRVVLPGFVDAHTHPVFAEPRLKDFESRLKGKTYAQIKEEGGGIVSSVNALRGATQAALAERLRRQSQRFLECGTTTIEAKSGYGLDLDSELKSLRAMRDASELTALEIVPTFLGAHAVPPEYAGRAGDYVELLCREGVPAVAKEKLARFVDVFCEKGYFSEEESERVLAAGAKAGLEVKIHAEQLSRSGGARLAAKLKARSADHLDCADAEDLARLKEAGTVAVLTPGANHFLGMAEYPPARRILDAGLPVALATDFNPGTCPCWNMQEAISLACARMRMTAEEAITAATINGAHALGLGKTHGSLEPGKQADVIVLDCEDYRELPYWFGANLVSAVFKKGTLVHRAQDFRV